MIRRFRNGNERSSQGNVEEEASWYFSNSGEALSVPATSLVGGQVGGVALQGGEGLDRLLAPARRRRRLRRPDRRGDLGRALGAHEGRRVREVRVLVQARSIPG